MCIFAIIYIFYWKLFAWLPVLYFFFMEMVDMFPSALRNFVLDPRLTPFLEMFGQEF